MIRYLSLEELLELHRLVLQQTGGLEGLRDLGGLESVVAQPQMTFRNVSMTLRQLRNEFSVAG